MKQIKHKDTKPEMKLRKALWHSGVRYRVDYREVIGKPDIAITKYNIAVFVDGEFWHGYNWSEKRDKIKSNRSYWIPKIEGNMERDKKVNRKLKEKGWKVIRFWEKEVKKELEECVEEVLAAVESKQGQPL